MELTRMKKEESGYAAYGTYLSSYLSEFKEKCSSINFMGKGIKRGLNFTKAK